MMTSVGDMVTPKSQINYMWERMQSEENFLQRVKKMDEEREKHEKMNRLMELRKKAYEYRNDWGKWRNVTLFLIKLHALKTQTTSNLISLLFNYLIKNGK